MNHYVAAALLVLFASGLLVVIAAINAGARDKAAREDAENNAYAAEQDRAIENNRLANVHVENERMKAELAVIFADMDPTLAALAEVDGIDANAIELVRGWVAP